MFFVLGYVMTNNGKCIEKIISNIHVFVVLAFIATVSFVFLRYSLENIEQFKNYYNQMTYKYKLIMAFFQGIAEYSLVMVIIGFAKKYLNINNRLYKYLSKTSFALYMFHYIIINVVMYYLIKININYYAMYFIAIITVYILFIILFELIISRINILKYICGIK
jgi:peptidoglycan/LPS O-acetylase OafA/YrhL